MAALTVLLLLRLLSSVCAGEPSQTATIRCPDGYYLLGGGCYFVSEGLHSGSEADKFCRNHGGRAAVVESPEEMELLKESLLDSTVFLGVNMQEYRDNLFSFLLKMAGHSGYTNFHVGEPDDYGSENCVVAHEAHQFSWEDVHCTERYPVLCKTKPILDEKTPPPATTLPPSTTPFSTTTPLTTQTPSPASTATPNYCDDDEHYFNNTCFWAHAVYAYTWTEAQEACRARSMELASVHSKEENSFMYDLINYHNEQYTSSWIGFTDADIETIFVWTDGTPVDYTNWYSGEPGSDDAYDCTFMSDGNDAQWLDYDCSRHAGVLCRRTASP